MYLGEFGRGADPSSGRTWSWTRSSLVSRRTCGCTVCSRMEFGWLVERCYLPPRLAVVKKRHFGRTTPLVLRKVLCSPPNFLSSRCSSGNWSSHSAYRPSVPTFGIRYRRPLRFHLRASVSRAGPLASAIADPRARLRDASPSPDRFHLRPPLSQGSQVLPVDRVLGGQPARRGAFGGIPYPAAPPPRSE